MTIEDVLDLIGKVIFENELKLRCKVAFDNAL